MSNPEENSPFVEIRPEFSLCKRLFLAVAENDIEVIRKSIEEGYNVNHSDFELKLIHYASKINRSEIIRLLCEAGARVNERDRAYECTPLIKAVFHGHLESVKVLLEFNADFDAYSTLGISILEMACVHQSNLKIVETLFKAGAKTFHLNGHNILSRIPEGGFKDRVADLLIAGGARFNAGMVPRKVPALSMLCVSKVRNVISEMREENLFITVKELPVPHLIKRLLLHLIDLESDECTHEV